MDIDIKLTRGLVTVISEEDSASTKSSWYGNKQGKSFYAQRASGAKKIYLHREIKERELGRALLRNEYVDHIDGDGLNNLRANLRLANVSQNAANKGRTSRNNSGYVGVCFIPASLRWRASIRIDGRKTHLGLFDDILDAARTYDIACVREFGEFARPNYPAAAYGLADWPDRK